MINRLSFGVFEVPELAALIAEDKVNENTGIPIAPDEDYTDEENVFRPAGVTELMVTGHLVLDGKLLVTGVRPNTKQVVQMKELGYDGDDEGNGTCTTHSIPNEKRLRLPEKKRAPARRPHGHTWKFPGTAPA